VCPKDGTVVPRNEAMRGFADEEGQVVALTNEEVKSAHAEASDAISVAEFVPLGAVDPVAYGGAYYLVPDGKSKATRSAYGLFLTALRDSRLVAIGETVSRGREDLVMLRPGEELLVMHRLHRPAGVRSERSVAGDKDVAPRPSKAELGLAEQLIAGLQHETFDPTRYEDDDKKRLEQVIATSKKARGTVDAEGEGEGGKTPGKVVDLMAALRASLGAGAKAKPVRRRHAARARPRARAHR
jgi:DNA end-binding protein Ku